MSHPLGCIYELERTAPVSPPFYTNQYPPLRLLTTQYVRGFEGNPSKMSAKVITIGTLKGGTGKTTVSTNIAAELNRRGKKVLLIDADPQGGSTKDFGISIVPDPETGDPGCAGRTLGELLYTPEHLKEHEPALEDCIVQHTDEELSNLHILPASYRALEAAEQTLEGIEATACIYQKIVAPLRERYDYIIIDTPPRLGTLTQAAIFASDYAIPLVGGTASTYSGAVSFVAQVEQINRFKMGLPPTAIPFWVVANWRDSHEWRSMIRPELESEEGVRVLNTFLISALTASSIPTDYMVPAVIGAPNSRYSKLVVALVDEMVSAGL